MAERGLKSEVMKLAWEITRANAAAEAESNDRVVDAIQEQGKENTLKDKENKKEQNLFFSKLFSKMTSALTPKAGVLGKVNPSTLAKGVAVALLALPAMAGALISGFMGPAIAAIQKIPGVAQITGIISKVSGKIPLLGKIFDFIFDIIRGPGRFIDDLIRKFPIFGRVLGVFKTVGKIFGKVFWPLTLLIAAIEGGIEAWKAYQAGAPISEVLLSFVDGFISSLTFGLVDIRQGIGENMRRILDGIIEYGGIALDWISTNVPYYIGVIGDEMAFFFQFTLPNALRDAWDSLINWFTGEGETGMIGDAMDFLADMMATIGSVLYSIGEGIINVGTGFIKGFGGIFMDFIWWLTEKIAEIQVGLVNYINESAFGDYIIGDEWAADMNRGLEEIKKMRAQRTADLEKERAEEEKIAEEEMKAKREAREAERQARKEAREAMRAEREAMLAARRGTDTPGANLREQQQRADAAQQFVDDSPFAGPPAPANNVNTFINTENNTFTTPPMILQDPAWFKPFPIIA